MKKRVALVLSGGVSLGSYIAGALDELLRWLEADGNFEIDVITGASAGATTAALIAHSLLYRGSSTRLHDVWVRQVDMADLLAPHLADDQLITLLSNRRLNAVAREVLTWPASGAEVRRSPLVGTTLTVALTITNVEGLSYKSRIKMHADGRAEPFIQDRFAEQETFVFDTAVPPTDSIWERIQQVGIASAALPLVFPPVVLERRAENKLHYPQRPEFEGPANFTYCDGGVFNNLPIDLAWHYARQNDAPGDERWVIIVDPSQDIVRPVSATPVWERPVQRSLLAYGRALLTAVFMESRAVQFDREVVIPSKTPEHTVARGQAAIPGIDRSDVELLDKVALVLPQADDKPLKGSYLICALSAFLDERFRQYDFQRGVVDARRVAQEVLGITAQVERPEGQHFYTPDLNPELNADISHYAALDAIPSSHDTRRSVRRVFEEGLSLRLKAIVNRLDPPGPDAIYAWALERLLLPRMGELW